MGVLVDAKEAESVKGPARGHCRVYMLKKCENIGNQEKTFVSGYILGFYTRRGSSDIWLSICVCYNLVFRRR